ncbi:phage integrase N-terminal SAM-like domain-containing protein [Marinobacter sp. 71-i]|uniref:Phage integrase N-terminal SAM-like domain-containing protein n=1 Tax=Marinobacter iranensis TaxID=2962607 RepID=A0ABT5YD55_9GAMM|nr:phage integrase N-terminal SAM-like domain-containing protein [Marinobacter iranensis]MDF0751504.1 phage integrase N-terminal SAM-like domain-containing protein [Marinobacter iranensis]
MNHYSIRTEKTYWYWIRYFIRFHEMKHPLTMGPRDVNEFLTWLAVHRNVAAATQTQALNSLVFLYDKVLDKPLGDVGTVIRSKKPRRGDKHVTVFILRWRLILQGRSGKEEPCRFYTG